MLRPRCGKRTLSSISDAWAAAVPFQPSTRISTSTSRAQCTTQPDVSDTTASGAAAPLPAPSLTLPASCAALTARCAPGLLPSDDVASLNRSLATSAAAAAFSSSELPPTHSPRQLARGRISQPSSSGAAGGCRLAAAAALTTLAPAEAAAQGFGPVVGAMQLIDGLHVATGLPWWATLSLTAIGVRAAMLPLSLRQMRAAAAAGPLFQEARALAAAEAAQAAGSASSSIHDTAPQSPAAAPGAVTHSRKPTSGASSRQQPRKALAFSGSDGGASAGGTATGWPEEGQEAGQRPEPRPALGRVAALFHELRTQRGAPHPGWIVAVPLIQLPVFVTSVWAIRRMAVASWPGFADGGALWFPDLTVSALDLSAAAVQGLVPLGSAGAVLPAAVAAVMFANISCAFGGIGTGGKQRTGALPAWLAEKLRLALEWLTVPMLLLALQLPQAPLVYWLTSGGFSLGQHLALRSPAVRTALGLTTPTNSSAARPTARPTARPVDARPPQGSRPPPEAQVRPEARLFATGTADVAALFTKAAELVAARQAGSAAHVLGRILQLSPDEPRAHFALGQVSRQVRASLGDWPAAAAAYGAAAAAESDPQQAARARLGRGVALDRQGDVEGALSSLLTAADLAAADGALESSRRPDSSGASRQAAGDASGGTGSGGGGGGRTASGGGVSGGGVNEGISGPGAASPGQETAIRALLAAGSLLARAGRKQEAADVVRRAVRLDPRLRKPFLEPLEAELVAGP